MPTLTLNINIFLNYVFEYCNISDGVIGKKCTSSKEKHFYKTNLIINSFSDTPIMIIFHTILYIQLK